MEQRALRLRPADSARGGQIGANPRALGQSSFPTQPYQLELQIHKTGPFLFHLPFTSLSVVLSPYRQIGLLRTQTEHKPSQVTSCFNTNSLFVAYDCMAVYQIILNVFTLLTET